MKDMAGKSLTELKQMQKDIAIEQERRKKEKDIQKVEDPDWSGVIEMAEEEHSRLIEDPESETDPQYFMEGVMEVIYGKGYFDKIYDGVEEED
jgi:hypothetical protein